MNTINRKINEKIFDLGPILYRRVFIPYRRFELQDVYNYIYNYLIENDNIKYIENIKRRTNRKFLKYRATLWEITGMIRNIQEENIRVEYD